MFEKLCMPALIYFVYALTHVVVDLYKGMYNIALIHVWIGVVFTILLNILCKQGMGIMAWIIISIPFILMTVIAFLAMFVLRVNPATGQPLPANSINPQFSITL